MPMTFTSDTAPAARVRTLPTGTLDSADLWLMEQEQASNEDPTFDPDNGWMDLLP